MTININVEKIEISSVNTNVVDKEAGENIQDSFDPYKYQSTVEAIQELGDIEQAVMFDNNAASAGKTKVVVYLESEVADTLNLLAVRDDTSLSEVVSDAIAYVCLATGNEDERMEKAYDEAININFPHPDNNSECTDGFCEVR